MYLQSKIYVAQDDVKNDNLLSGIIVCSLLSVGIAIVFASLTCNRMCGVAVVFEAIVLSVVLGLLKKRDTALNIFRAAAVIVFALLVMFNFAGIGRAMLNSANAVIEYINSAYSKDFVILGVQKASTTEYILLYGILTAVATMAVNYFVVKRSVVGVTLFAFLFAIAVLALKCGSAIAAIPLIIIGWIGCWSKCSAGDNGSVIYICLGMAAVFLIGGSILLPSGFKGFKVLDELHEDTENYIYNLRFGEDTLPKGDMLKADTMLDGEKTVMTVTFEEPEALYLKGFVGGVFSENKWIEYKEDTYLGEWSGMLDYFNINKFGPNNIFSQYCEVGDENVKTSVVCVENTGADRSFVYLPFTARAVENIGVYSNRDLNVKSSKVFGAGKYYFVNTVIDEEPELLSTQRWVTNPITDEQIAFMEKENVYRAFVEDTYLELDEKTRNEIDEVFYKDFDIDSGKVGTYTITTRIRSVLKLLTSYAEHPPKPDDADFVGWFLAKSRSGNSAYYATTAVMAYRAANIPARYVEGYFVSDKDVENLNETGKSSIVLTNKNAHAWVEIYRDGLGWVQVEVTPGFYAENSDEMEVIDISRISEMLDGAAGGGGEYFTGTLSMYSPEALTRSDDRMSSGLRILLALICLLTILSMTVYIRYMVLAHLKNERLYGASKDDTTSYMLMYICNALNADGVEANPDNPRAFRKQILDKYDNISKYEFDRVMELISRSSYGGARLREHELRTIRIFTEKLADEIVKDKSILRKLWIKIIKVV